MRSKEQWIQTLDNTIQMVWVVEHGNKSRDIASFPLSQKNQNRHTLLYLTPSSTNKVLVPS